MSEATSILFETEGAQICQYIFLGIGYVVTVCNFYYAVNLIRRVPIKYNYMLLSVLLTWMVALVALTVHTKYSLFLVERNDVNWEIFKNLDGVSLSPRLSVYNEETSYEYIRIPITAIQMIPQDCPYYYIRRIVYASIMTFNISYKLSLLIFIMLYLHRFKCIRMIKSYPKVYDIIVYALTWLISIAGLTLTLVSAHKVPFSRAWDNDGLSETTTGFSLLTIAWSCLWDTIIPLVFLTIVYRRQKSLEQMQGYGFETTLVTPVIQRWLVLMLIMIVASTWTGFIAHAMVYMKFRSSTSYQIVLRLWACLHTFEFSGSLVFMALAKKIMSYRHVIRTAKQMDNNPASMMSDYGYLSDVDISYI